MAKDNLPSVAAEYHEAANKLNAVLSNLDGVMHRPDRFGDALGPVHSAWVALHGDLAEFLAETDTNLTDTAEALNQAVEQYAATDRGAKAELDRLRHTVGEPKPDQG
ncbi:ABC-type transporter Mla subunit MlaD [Kibdelosporangium banguiense]|uniref:ABC-type transporter Mla subunit MlaD n=1 Tax=Kibdelosporangium banguiense TaxID=1365924 RepID=A0ABS4TKB3_9PSEU|nr:type VII secretion target [Kibdelosporangium banguiense]MBP2324429.1 ABC-type transporter Mla subunit MlaD [Kibdelosporangium banguiense]